MFPGLCNGCVACELLLPRATHPHNGFGGFKLVPIRFHRGMITVTYTAKNIKHCGYDCDMSEGLFTDLDSYYFISTVYGNEITSLQQFENAEMIWQNTSARFFFFFCTVWRKGNGGEIS